MHGMKVLVARGFDAAQLPLERSLSVEMVSLRKGILFFPTSLPGTPRRTVDERRKALVASGIGYKI